MTTTTKRQPEEAAHDVSDATPAKVEARSLTKVFGDTRASVTAFERVSFRVDEGEFLSVLGPSGCGKTTLLHVIAGLEQESAGEVLVDGVQGVNRANQFGYMFQKDLLMPWYRVVDNVALGLVIEGVSKSEARRRSVELMERYGLGAAAKRYPSQLSGGMRQRAALIRTLLLDRSVMLLDEPFGALDALTRSIMQEWLLEIWSDSKRTIIFVTHDVEEAVFLSDRVLVMSAHGRIKLDMPIDLPRPRTHEILSQPDFVKKKEELLRSIYEEGVAALERPGGSGTRS
jgi:ABC-type nitrate/sulfonate/bicarbonate transport system ATPase subunit